MSGIFGGGRQETTQQVQLPPYIQAAGEQNINLANQVAAGRWPQELGPYPNYTGPRVAGLSPQEIQANNMAAGMAPPGQALGGARQVAAASAQRFGGDFRGPEYNAANLAGFINPNLDAILGETRRQGDIDRSRITAQAAARRSLGGSGEAVQLSEQTSNQQRNIGLQTAQEYDRGAQRFMADRGQRLAENNAQAGQFNVEQNRGMQLAQFLLGAGQQEQGMTADQIRLLQGLGSVQRGLNQQNLDNTYQQFTEARDWPQRMLDIRMRALAGQPNQAATVTNAPGASAGAQIAQGAGGALALARLFGFR